MVARMSRNYDIEPHRAIFEDIPVEPPIVEKLELEEETDAEE